MPEDERVIPNAAHEHTDIHEGFIWGAAGSMAVLLAVCALVVWWMYPGAMADLKLSLPLPRFPEPRLQSKPSADMAAFHAAELLHLNSAGWIDKAHGIVHIPIADAMDKVAAEGIPGWPTEPVDPELGPLMPAMPSAARIAP